MSQQCSSQRANSAGRVGVWRFVELFDAHGVKATIFTPGRICELYPQALRAVVKSGHEVADHMWEHRVPKEPALEEDHLAKTVAALERVAGRRPTGTRSRHSAALLRQYGYIYRSEGSADQRPHYEFDEGGANGLVNLPMHYVIDDAMYFNFNWLGSIRRHSGSLTRSGSVTSGGRRCASNTMSAAISTSVCTRSNPAARCASRCSTG
jgi:peptidoglycan/xylan/chitin deacetylase (PgdA/CDA1 family)